jgi:hypothetical protein
MLEQAAACVRAEAVNPEHYQRVNSMAGLDMRVLHLRGTAMGLNMEINLTLLSSPVVDPRVYENLIDKGPLTFSKCQLCGKLISEHNGDECP